MKSVEASPAGGDQASEAALPEGVVELVSEQPEYAAVDLYKYDWGIRHQSCGKFDGRCFEGRLRHPYSGHDVTCFADSLLLIVEQLQRCAWEAEQAQAKYMKGRKSPDGE